MKPVILRINTSTSQGGAALSALNIQSAVANLGVNTWMLNARDQQNSEDNILWLGETDLRLRLNVLSYRILGIDGAANKALWRRFLYSLEDFDLIHLHNVHGYYMPLDVLMELLSRPCVWTLHDFWLATGGPGFPLPALENRRRIERLIPFANFRYPAEWIDRSSKRRQRLFSLISKYQPSLVAVTHTMADRLRLMGVDAANLTVIPHGFYGSDLAPSDADCKKARQNRCWPMDKHIFLFVSAQVDNPAKGCDVFLNALSHLPNNDSWIAYVVGDRFESLQKKVAELSLEVQFLGEIDEVEMREYFRACDTYVTSTFDESFGRTVVEALAEGAQVVCSDLPVLREVSGKSAIFFKPGDAIELSKQLMRVLEHPSSEDRYTVANEIRKRFSQKRMAQSYVELYESEINKKRYL